MIVTFTDGYDGTDTLQGISRFYRMNPENTNLPIGHAQPWKVITYEGKERQLPWEYQVHAVKDPLAEMKFR